MNKNFSYKEILEHFVEWEYKNDLFKIVIDELYIWEHVRFDIYNIILSKITNGTTKNMKHYMYSSTKQNKNIFQSIMDGNPIFFPKKDLLFIGQSHRKKQEDGYYTNPHIDYLIDNIKYSYYILENREPASRDIPIKIKNLRFFNPISFSMKSKLSIKSMKKIFYIIDKIERAYIFKFSKDERKFITSIMEIAISSRNNFRTYYKIILKQIQPKIIFVLCPEINYNKYLIELSKEMNIITVRFPHSNGGAYDPEEYYYGNTPLKSMFDFGFEYGKARILQMKFPMINDSKFFSIGSVYHENKINEVLEKKELIKNIKKTILFASDYFIESELDILAKETLEILDASQYNVIFKLHPGEENWRNKYPSLRNSKVKVVGASREDDFYTYLIEADFLITSASSVLYDAMALPIKCFVYKRGLYEANSYLYDNGFAKLINNKEELIDEILLPHFKKNDNIDIIYTPNPRENFNFAVNKLMKYINRN